MHAFYFVVDENYLDIASAQALNLVRLWNCDVHIFVERRNLHKFGVELTFCNQIFYHYDKLSKSIPPNVQITDRWPSLVYARIFAPFLLKKYSRLIYLDADIHCDGSKQLIWDIPLPNGIGAVQDTGLISMNLKWKNGFTNLLSLKGINSLRYFNSGFLLIDPNIWCKHDFVSQLQMYFEKYIEHADTVDQDFLNFLFQEKWVELSPSWNFQTNLLNYGIEECFEPIFMHFTRPQKPWFGNSHNDHHYFDKYSSILEEAGFDIQNYCKLPETAFSGRFVPMLKKVISKFRKTVSKMGILLRRERRLRKEWSSAKEENLAFFNDALGNDLFADDERKFVEIADRRLEYDGRFLLDTERLCGLKTA